MSVRMLQIHMPVYTIVSQHWSVYLYVCINLLDILLANLYIVDCLANKVILSNTLFSSSPSLSIDLFPSLLPPLSFRRVRSILEYIISIAAVTAVSSFPLNKPKNACICSGQELQQMIKIHRPPIVCSSVLLCLYGASYFFFNDK